MIFTPESHNIQSNERNSVNPVLKEIFEEDCYFPAFTNKVILDIGACIGLFSMYAHKFAKQIYAVEPHPVNYANLVKNVQNNHLDKVKTFNLAISEQNGEGWVRDTGHLEGTTFGFDRGSHRVKALTLASFFKENNIKFADIVKIDTEGSEHEIFRAKDILEVENKIGMLIVEVHGEIFIPFKGWTHEHKQEHIFLFHKP